jgi:hypothetical protein
MTEPTKARSPRYSQAKGYDAEHAIEELLKSIGYREVYRPRAGATDDQGDIGGLSVVVSVKNCQALALASWVTDANIMGVRVNKLAVVWHKRRMRSNPFEWFVTMDGLTFTEFLGAYDRGRP